MSVVSNGQYPAADPYGGQYAGFDSNVPPGDPYAPAGYPNQSSQYEAMQDDRNRNMMSANRDGRQVCQDTGIAPRRCTDPCCCFVFLIYIVIMITIVSVTRARGDTRRLTHGMDYYGRLCGVDAQVAGQPFLFWCRKDPLKEPSGTPSELNLDNPSCVAACPTNYTDAQIPCLQDEQTQSGPVPGGQFGNEETQSVMSSQSVWYTAPYETRPRGGRYCMPVDSDLKDSILGSGGPLSPWSRNKTNNVIGTIKHLWWILFVVTILAVLMGCIVLASLKYCPRTTVTLFIIPMILVCLGFGIYFMLAIWPLLFPERMSNWYIDANPLFDHYTVQWAAFISIVIGLCLLLIAACFINLWFLHDIHTAADILHASYKCVLANKASYLFLPFIGAIYKFFIFWLLLWGFASLFGTGILEKNRIHINGDRYAGLSRVWHREWTMLIWIIIYFIGAVWVFEIMNALLQFLCAFNAVTWYYTPKEGKHKVSPPCPCAQGTKDAFLYHFGSICMGAFLIPIFRPLRIAYWFLGGYEGHTGTCEEKCGFCKCCVQLCVKAVEWSLCFPCMCLKSCLKGSRENWDCFNKDAYTDVIVRAHDYGPAKLHSWDIMYHSHPVVKYLHGACMTMTIVCVIAIAFLCGLFAWVVVTASSAYNDPSSSYYIADPVLITVLAALLGGSVAYGFLMIIDHTADVLLWCYSWNQKFYRHNVDRYIPDDLRYVVGYSDEMDDQYPYYGRAKQNMYLSTWMPTKSKKDKKAQRAMETQGQAYTPQGSYIDNAGGSPSNYYQGESDRQGLLSG